MISPGEMLRAVQQECHVRIDLSRYAENIRVLTAIAGTDRELMAVVKANAYGHGAIECARTALRNGATQLAVARIWEGIQLRRAGVDAPILVLGGPNLGAVDLALEHELTLSVGTREAVDAVKHAVAIRRQPLRVHLKVDTGLHRYGALPELARRLATELSGNPGIELEGLYGHFSSADEEDTAPTLDQIAVAESLVDDLKSEGITFKYIHLPNSAATIAGLTGCSNMVRAGIATYGLAPSPQVPLPAGIRQVMSVHGVLTRVHTLAEGDGVSYGLTYRSQRAEVLGTVPIGYADGLPRSLSNRGWFVVAGRRCPIRGRVCMDQTVAGLPDDVSPDATVQIIGDGGDQAMSLDDVAAIDDTINYEVATRLGARMPRVYVVDGLEVKHDVPVLPARDE